MYASTIQEDLALLRSGTVSPGSTQEKALLVRYWHRFWCYGPGTGRAVH